MSAASSQTPTPQWSLDEWLRRNVRWVGRVRLVLVLTTLAALATVGPLLSEALGGPLTARDPATGCVYAAEEANPPTYGKVIESGTAFPLTWSIKNTGTCPTWGQGVAFVRQGGQLLSEQDQYPITGQLQAQTAPLGTLTIITVMSAPAVAGTYETAWQMHGPDGQPFGPIMTQRIQDYLPGTPPPPAPLNHPPPTVFEITGTMISAMLSVSGFLYALPALLGLILVLWRGNDFLMELYRLKPPASGWGHVLAMMFGMRTPGLHVRDGKIERYPANAATEVIGGPGWLTVADRNAAVLERGAGFSRIVGPGYHLLQPHERVRGAVDLHIQQRRQREKILAKDGIPLELDVDLVFRVTEKSMPGEAPPSPPPLLGPITRLKRRLGFHVPAAVLETSRPHRFSREAVRRIVYETTVFSPDVPQDWTRSFATVRAGDVSDQLVEMRLDDISMPDDPDFNPRHEVVEKGLADARKNAARIGIDVIDLTMGLIEAPADIKKHVEEQRLTNWQVEWRRRARQLQAEGNARALQAMQEARAEAQANMIEALTEGFRIAIANNPNASRDVIALRFIDTFEALIQTKLDTHELEEHANLSAVVATQQQRKGKKT